MTNTVSDLRPDAESGSPLDVVYTALLEHGCEWSGGEDWTCPAHDDDRPSLGVKAGDRQPVLLHCAAGCKPRDILAALELSWQDVMGGRAPVARKRVYHYTDEKGRGLIDVIRFDLADGSKRFAQRPYNAKGVRGADGKLKYPGIDGVRRVLYALPDVLEAVRRGKTIYLVEGEKSADLLRWLGEVATTQLMGADQEWPEEFTAVFAGLGSKGGVVRIVADWDRPGLRRALEVGRKLAKAKVPVEVYRSASVDWSRQHGLHHDIEDHVYALKGRDDLVRMSAQEVKAAIPTLPDSKKKLLEGKVSSSLSSRGRVDESSSDDSGVVDTVRPSPEKIWPSPSNPLKVAREFVKRFYLTEDAQGQRWRTLHYWQDTFYAYSARRGLWRPLDTEVVRGHVGRALLKAVYVSLNKTKTGVETDYLPWSPTTTRLNDVMNMLKDTCYLGRDVEPGSFLASEGSGLGKVTVLRGPGSAVAFRNTLLDLDSYEPTAVGPWFFNLSTVDYDYAAGSGAKCPQWVSWLNETFAGDVTAVKALQEWFGYVLSGDTSLQKAAFIVGPPRSGKGTITHVLEHMIGRHAYVNPDIFALGERFGLQNAIGKLAAIIGDARFTGRMAQETVTRLLQVTGGDGVTVDRKNKEPWNGVLTARFTICSNELPMYPDASGAFVNRFLVWQIPGEGHLGHEDTGLLGRLLEEMPGVLEWALDGLIRLRIKGSFTVVESARDYVEEMLVMSSPIREFWGEAMVECDSERSSSRQDVYNAYRAWSTSRGMGDVSQSVFTRNVNSARVVRDTRRLLKVNRKVKTVFMGWRLLSSEMG